MGRIPVFQVILEMKWDHVCQALSRVPGILLESCKESLLLWFTLQALQEKLQDRAANNFHRDPTHEHAYCLVSIGGKFIPTEWKAEEIAQAAGIRPSSKG